MPLIAPAYEQVHPSFMMPEILLPYTQASGAFDLLPNGEPRAILSEGDLAVYIRRLDVRTKMAASQSTYNELPSAEIVPSQIVAPTYMQRVGTIYDHHDTAAAARNGFALPEAMRLATQQGHAQLARSALLYGYNPANGEGFVYANGVTAVSLPPDSNGNDTAVTYDNGQMAFFFNEQVLNVKVRTNNLGIGRKFVMIGPQRTLGLFGYNVVQLVQFQRVGAGTASTIGLTNQILMDNGDEMIWGYDDTLIGKGAGGTDLLILCMPEVAKPKGARAFNTNRFADLAPGLEATVGQFCDMVAPREITAPLARGATDTLSELRLTPGWVLRPESTTLISIQYQ